MKTGKMVDLIHLGWREWIILPNHDNFIIKAKIDTGARSSALDATHIEEYHKNNQKWIKFRLNQHKKILDIHTKLVKYKKIINSFGNTETRPVVIMKIQIGLKSWKTELTLTRRNHMSYPMLIGRSSLKDNYVIHSHKSYLKGKHIIVK